MKTLFFLFALSFILFTFSFLFADNYMNQLAYLEGEQPRSFFGRRMAALDFNGDGYDDLVVSSPQVYWKGRLYFYLGGEEFDDQVDFTLTGELGSILGSYLTNIGDINNDGCEDLGYSLEDADSLYLNILLGNTEQDTIPDFVMAKADLEYHHRSIRSLGDINSDGFDDVGIAWTQYPDLEPVEFYIIYGNESEIIPELFGYIGGGLPGFSGVGDVNNDGFDDFCIGYYESGYTNILYYGGTTIDTTLSVTLWQESFTNMTLGLPAGDLNADGYDDFPGHFSFDVDIWLGCENITSNYNFTIYDGSGGGLQGFGYDHGDVNNDSYSDMVFGSPSAIGNDGEAFLYLGSESPNNSVDLYFPPLQVVNHEYGTAVAIGRFNGDEYEDVAIAGPVGNPPDTNPGYVYVFAGNGELEETTPVSIQEEEIPTVDGIEFNAYPNPFNPETTIQYSIHKDSRVEINIYNIKGQKIKTLVHEVLPAGEHSNIWNGKDSNDNRVSSGIYFYRLEAGDFQKVKKMVLVK